MTEAEVAGLFGVRTRTVRRWALDGRLPRVHIAGTTRYRRSDIEALIGTPIAPFPIDGEEAP
jgi:excisionase family DNA binding protein